MTRWELWSSGIAAQIEDRTARGLTVTVRGGQGTGVSQDPGTGNWCHLAVPTPVLSLAQPAAAPPDIGASNVHLHEVTTSLRTEGDARLERVDVWIGDRQVLQADAINTRGERIDRRLPLSRPQLLVDRAGRAGGVTVSLYVAFDGVGRVWLRGAGAVFEAADQAGGQASGVTRYLGNSHTRELHDLKNTTRQCQIDEIRADHRRYFESPERAAAPPFGYDTCAYCMG